MSAATRARLIATAVLGLVLLAVIAIAPDRSPRPSGETPEQHLAGELYDGVVAATRDGDVRRYLACFAEPLRGELAAAVSSQGRAAFAESLRRFYRTPVTGVAVSEQQIDGDRATARLEWVYRDDSDVQMVSLVRERGRWLIAELSGKTRIELDLPWGTPVLQ